MRCSGDEVEARLDGMVGKRRGVPSKEPESFGASERGASR